MTLDDESLVDINPRGANMEEYLALADNFRLRDDFLRQVKNKIASGSSLFAAFSKAFMEDFEKSGLLKPFEGKFDAEIRDFLRHLLDRVKIRYGTSGSMTDEAINDPARFMNRCIRPNLNTILFAISEKLKDLYKMNSVMENAVGLSTIIAEQNKKIRRVLADNEELHQIASKDPLTGLFNRRAFTEHVQNLAHGEKVVCIIFDADHFKMVNDKYGHPCGDIVLKKMAKKIQDHARLDNAFRLGGEEFAVALELNGKWSKEQVLQMIEDIRRELAEDPELEFEANVIKKDDPNFGKIEKFRKTLSIGVAFGKSEDFAGGTEGAIFKRADEASYTSKYSGRDKVTVVEL